MHLIRDMEDIRCHHLRILYTTTKLKYAVKRTIDSRRLWALSFFIEFVDVNAECHDWRLSFDESEITAQ